MSESRYASRFRYLDAADVVGEGVSFTGLAVLGADGTRIGGVDGFVLDQAADRATHIVVDSGGWFPSQRLLLPIGHGEVAADRKSLLANVTRNALELLPEFDAHQFGEFSDQELQAFERNTVIACCPHEPLEEGEVKVRLEQAEESENSFYLTVRDNGSGLPRGFEWQTAATLGLQLVQVLARQLGGRIALDSSSGAAWRLSFTERK